MSDSQPNSPHQAAEGAGSSAPSSLFSKANKADLGAAVLIIALCLLAWWETGNFDPVIPGMRDYVIAPAVFPRMVLGIIIAMTLVLPFEQAIRGEEGKILDKDRTEKIKPISYITALLLVVMAVVHPYLGSFLTILGICILMPLLWGDRNYKILIPFAVLLPITMTIIFVIALKVNYVPGIFKLEFQF